jgi:hypothetical protein
MDSAELPPVFRPVVLREVHEAFSQACRVAAAEGAGTLFQVGRFDLVDFAVVLEPEHPLRLARTCFYAGMNALADAVSSCAPPEAPVCFRWPDRILLDGALVGGARLGWPQSCAEDDRPEWLVFGATVRRVSIGAEEPGARPGLGSLEELGAVLGDHRDFVARFARFFLLALHEWSDFGPAGSLRRYTPRLSGRSEAVDLRASHGGAPDAVAWQGSGSLAAALATPSWRERELSGWL